MKELIDERQAHLLMLTVLVLAPLVGLAWGARAKRIGRGLSLGLAAGAGNFALWTAYNALTDRLGLDTVKNLLVNLALFVTLGAVAGAVWGIRAARTNQGGDDGDVAGDQR